MPDAQIESAIAHWAPRFTTQGVDPGDFARVTGSVDRWDQWLDAWCANGDLHARLAEAAESQGRFLTAGEAWVRAALSYHFAKFVWVLDMDRHREARRLSVAAMSEAHRLLDPTAERVPVPFGDGALVGVLRRPRSAGRAPVVLLLPGLDSTKDEFFHWENVFLRRGTATFSLDGPGQGESADQFPLRPDYEVATTAALDALQGREDIDMDAVGIVGVSMGGYYAARSAAHDHRIRAAVTVGGPYESGSRFDARPEISRQAFIAYCQVGTMDEARAVGNRMTLDGILGRLTQPLLVIFGRQDRLVPYQQAEQVAREAPNAELVMFEEGNHVCNNIPYKYRPLAADWIKERLRP